LVSVFKILRNQLYVQRPGLGKVNIIRV